MTHPTDALRLVPLKLTPTMIAAARGFNMKNVGVQARWEAMLSAAPASPLPGGGPTCQVCGSKIEGWICQGCGAQFHENDAGSLVLGMATAEPAGQLSKNLGQLKSGQCSGITGELDPRLVEWGYTSLDEAMTHLGKLLDDQTAFDGLAAPTGDAK